MQYKDVFRFSLNITVTVLVTVYFLKNCFTRKPHKWNDIAVPAQFVKTKCKLKEVNGSQSSDRCTVNGSESLVF